MSGHGKFEVALLKYEARPFETFSGSDATGFNLDANNAHVLTDLLQPAVEFDGGGGQAPVSEVDDERMGG
ncbi:hypothetical protein GCM10009611_05330 [Arthrobacter roseus]